MTLDSASTERNITDFRQSAGTVIKKGRCKGDTIAWMPALLFVHGFELHEQKLPQARAFQSIEIDFCIARISRASRLEGSGTGACQKRG